MNRALKKLARLCHGTNLRVTTHQNPETQYQNGYTNRPFIASVDPDSRQKSRSIAIDLVSVRVRFITENEDGQLLVAVLILVWFLDLVKPVLRKGETAEDFLGIYVEVRCNTERAPDFTNFQYTSQYNALVECIQFAFRK